jgi:lipopolysaccharide transport system permease protein
VRYRDVRHVIPFLVQLWLFASPVAYPSELVPSGWRWLYAANPMVGVIDGFRWAFVGTAVPGRTLAVGALAALTTLVAGLFVFRRFEDSFADEI